MSGTPTRLLQISSGTGPREVREFVAELGEALAQVCARRGLELRSRTSVGEELAPRSLTLELRGAGPLDDLLGTHELVRARDTSRRRGHSKGSRKRWFVGVSVHRPPASGAARLVLDPRELEIRCDRAGGPGGQHVNTCASAVRVLHRPSGVAVRVASERSQHQNRKLALARVASVLAAAASEEQAQGAAARRGAHHHFERGRPVRSWRCSPRRGGGLVCLSPRPT